MQLTKFDIDTFLRDYWQKQPVMINNPWKSWHNPLEPDELAGLACEEGIESRLITQTGALDDWKLEQGPFPETRFSELGTKHWSLLVQAVDHYIPEVAALIEPFRFIPNWRIDDIMASFAAEGGGVGPHFDQYDVFLIQGLGQRHWQIGQTCDQDTELLPHDDLRLLTNFNATDEWVCEPGDILYIPPGVSHNGVAIGDQCMTYSVGFRAPSRSELMGYWADDMLAEMKDDDRYGDPTLKTQQNPGEISADAVDQLHHMITEKFGDRAAFARWFGQYSSTPKYPDVDLQAEQTIEIAGLREHLANGLPLYRHRASRFSFIRQEPNSVLLFVDGESFTCIDESVALAELVCAKDCIAIDQDLLRSDSAMALIADLVNQGSLSFDQAG